MAQYRLEAPSGVELTLPSERLRAMLDTTRALFRDLEEDPRIGYFLDVGPAVPADSPEAAFPWNALDVRSDSSAVVRTPGNLREADRAYHNYAVLRMHWVHDGDPDVSCDSLMRVEAVAVDGFADGWLVSRTLFGAPAYPPLDEVGFAREAGVLEGLLAAKGDAQLGACAREWAEANPEAVEAYRLWRVSRFLGDGAGAPAPAGEADAGDAPAAGGVGAGDAPPAPPTAPARAPGEDG